MPKKYVLLLCIAFFYALWVYVLRPEPNLAALSHSYVLNERVQNVAEYQIRELESYAGEFRILGRKEYQFGREAELSPVDFAVGWGRMAEANIYQQIQIRQSNRWYFWRTESAPPIPIREIETSSANMHVIPSTAQVAKQLKRVQTGDMVYLKGVLVEVSAKDGWHWRSSLSREDTGNGACELMRVDEVRFL